MPFYEYRCGGCGHQFEELVRSMTEEPKVKCPACGSAKTVRQFSVFSTGVPSSGPSGKCAGCTDVKCPHSSR